MCMSGCRYERSNGDCSLTHNFPCDEDYVEYEDIDEPEEEYVSEQEIADAEDRYFDRD